MIRGRNIGSTDRKTENMPRKEIPSGKRRFCFILQLGPQQPDGAREIESGDKLERN